MIVRARQRVHVAKGGAGPLPVRASLQPSKNNARVSAGPDKIDAVGVSNIIEWVVRWCPVSALIANAAAVLALNFAARGYADGPPPKPSINYRRTPGTYDVLGRCWNWPWAFHHRFAPHIPSHSPFERSYTFDRALSSLDDSRCYMRGNF